MNTKEFVVQPGGTSREAKDGGYIFPVHLDAAFVTEFYPYWREEGISFMLVPFVEKSEPAPEPVTVPHNGETPAQILHARFFKLHLFWEFLEWASSSDPNIDDEVHAKMVFKEWQGINSCSEIDHAKLEHIIGAFNAWIPTRKTCATDDNVL